MADKQASKRFFYQTIADDFENLDNRYDVERRLRVVFDELLDGIDLIGKLVLDAGCGYGAFSIAAHRRGAKVVSLDIAEKLVKKAALNASTAGVVGDASRLSFQDDAFDIVLSSEMLEHTLAPEVIVQELIRVLRPAGHIVLTTPNKAWEWLVKLATLLRVRPFRGIESFLTWAELGQHLQDGPSKVIRHQGFHPWPFQLRLLQRLSEAVDGLLGEGIWGRLMINQAILARKVRG